MSAVVEKADYRKHLEALVTEHRQSLGTPMIYAAWYDQSSPDMHLLEICDGVSDPGDASWDTFQFLPPPEWDVPEGAKLRITYISYEEFLQGQQQSESRGHELLATIAPDHEVLYRSPSPAHAAMVEKISEAMGDAR